MNTFGRILRLTTFGESHGPAIGGVLDGFPAGLDLDLQQVQQALDHRNPSQAVIGSGRRETDQVEFLSGIWQGKSLGSPIAFLIRNQDARSEDYAVLEHAFRPGHADDTWQAKYGIRDYRGGGRASARETAVRVAGGALARQLLAEGLESSVDTSQLESQIAKALEDYMGGAASSFGTQVTDALEEQIDDYQKIIDLKKESLEVARDEEDYEREVAERVAEIAKVQEKIWIPSSMWSSSPPLRAWAER